MPLINKLRKLYLGIYTKNNKKKIYIYFLKTIIIIIIIIITFLAVATECGE